MKVQRCGARCAAAATAAMSATLLLCPPFAAGDIMPGPTEPRPSPDADPSQHGQLTAGDVDDNLNFDAFLEYKDRTVAVYAPGGQWQGGGGGTKPYSLPAEDAAGSGAADSMPTDTGRDGGMPMPGPTPPEYWENWEQTQQQGLPDPYLGNRISVRVADDNDDPYSCAWVEVRDELDVVQLELQAGTNGMLHLFPSIDGLLPVLGSEDGDELAWRVVARPPNVDGCLEGCSNFTDIVATTFGNALVTDNDDPVVRLSVGSQRQLPTKLEVALVVDTTGSMCDELAYLQTELEAVISKVVRDYGGDAPDGSGGVEVRVGLVSYRDLNDDYIVRTLNFTTPEEAATILKNDTCDGGGDYPEAMEQALEAASVLNWSEGNVARVLFLVADAPPHNQHLGKAVKAILDLRNRGVRLYGLAASGAAEKAEYLMRLMALLTGGRHLWLTDDSGIGNSHEEPKVTCYQVTRLDSLLVRVLGSELLGKRIEADNKTEILRTVGSQERGVCIIDVNPMDDADRTDPPTRSPTPGEGEDKDTGGGSGASEGGGSASSGGSGGFAGATDGGYAEESASSSGSGGFAGSTGDGSAGKAPESDGDKASSVGGETGLPAPLPGPPPPTSTPTTPTGTTPSGGGDGDDGGEDDGGDSVSDPSPAEPLDSSPSPPSDAGDDGDDGGEGGGDGDGDGSGDATGFDDVSGGNVSADTNLTDSDASSATALVGGTGGGVASALLRLFLAVPVVVLGAWFAL